MSIHFTLCQAVSVNYMVSFNCRTAANSTEITHEITEGATVTVLLQEERQLVAVVCAINKHCRLDV